jgi:hypothetical protein
MWRTKSTLGNARQGARIRITMREVLEFIKQFSPAKGLFLNGMCYWFAFILRNRFPDSEIWYEPIMNHFVCRIGGVFYDAAGGVAGENFQKWDDFKEADALHAERIIRYCIDKDV